MQSRQRDTWNPKAGRVTRAFDEWTLAERELRAFMSVGRRIAAESYDSAWERISHEPSDGEGPEIIDLLDAEFEGISSSQFDWLLMNLVVRDGVTLYEVYLEKALLEVAERIGAVVVADRSPTWRQLADAYQAMGLDPRPNEVGVTIALRDFLTHRRGELRTEALRERYDTAEFGFPDLSVRLDPVTVGERLDALADAVEAIDRSVFPLAWGHLPDAVRDGLPSKAPWLFRWT